MVSEYSHNSALLQNGKGKGKKEFKDWIESMLT
jgi:hypothetical protein